MPQNLLNSFMSFEKMIAPQIIQLIYFVVGALIILGGVFGGLYTMTNSFFGGLLQIVLFTPLALVFWRIWCELMILSFKIYDRLGTIAGETSTESTETQ